MEISNRWSRSNDGTDPIGQREHLSTKHVKDRKGKIHTHMTRRKRTTGKHPVSANTHPLRELDHDSVSPNNLFGEMNEWMNTGSDYDERRSNNRWRSEQFETSPRKGKNAIRLEWSSRERILGIHWEWRETFVRTNPFNEEEREDLIVSDAQMFWRIVSIDDFNQELRNFIESERIEPKEK